MGILRQNVGNKPKDVLLPKYRAWGGSHDTTSEGRNCGVRENTERACERMSEWCGEIQENSYRVSALLLKSSVV